MATPTNSILVLSGLPGSGKTTQALKWLAEDPEGRVRINYDDLRGDTPFNRAAERGVKALARKLAVEAITAGKSVVIDNTNLTERARAEWIHLGKEFGIPVEQHEIDTPVEVCIKRDKSREGKKRVGRAVIERMALFHGFIQDWENYNPNRFVLVDIDGTLADGSHRQHFLDEACLICRTDKKEALEQSDEPGQCGLCGSKEFTRKDWVGFHRNVAEDKPSIILITVEDVSLLSL